MRLRRALAVASAAGTLAAGGAGALAVHRWSRTASPDDDAAPLPDGKEVTVATDDGAELTAMVCGDADGPPVVMIHGWTQDRSVWSPVARRLCAAGHRVVAYDQRGHGRSTMGTALVTGARLGADVGAVLDALDLHDAVIVGHSMGGMAAQAFAIDHAAAVADRVRGLVLVGTSAGGVRVGLGRWTMPVTARVITSGQLDWALQRRGLGATLVRGTVGQRPVLAHLVATSASFVATPADVRLACVKAIREIDLYAGLAGIAVPTTIVAGSRDCFFPRSLIRRLVAGIPGARLELIAGAGHMLPLEVPDRVAELIAGQTRTTTTTSEEAPCPIPS
ncbi:MAG: alpha/beta fold hydrolase [Acidimicrobiales bacterium]